MRCPETESGQLGNSITSRPLLSAAILLHTTTQCSSVHILLHTLYYTVLHDDYVPLQSLPVPLCSVQPHYCTLHTDTHFSSAIESHFIIMFHYKVCTISSSTTVQTLDYCTIVHWIIVLLYSGLLYYCTVDYCTLVCMCTPWTIVQWTIVHYCVYPGLL